MAACSGIDTIAGDAVDGNAAVWGEREDAAVGSHGRGGCVGSAEVMAYRAAHVAFDHCGAELQAAHEEWPAGECSSRRLVLAVMAFVRPARDRLRGWRRIWQDMPIPNLPTLITDMICAADHRWRSVVVLFLVQLLWSGGVGCGFVAGNYSTAIWVRRTNERPTRCYDHSTYKVKQYFIDSTVCAVTLYLMRYL